MKKNIILLTNKFPYLSGETFLETEIQFLSDNFEKIYVFSFSKNKNKRETGKNIKTYSLNINGNTFLKLFVLITFPITNLFLKRAHLRNKKEKYSFLMAFFAYKKILKIIKKDKIQNIDLIYSYWLNFICTTGIFLKRKLNCKNVSRVHGGDLYSFRFRDGIVPCQEYNVINCDYIYAISKNGKDYLSKKFPNFKNKFFVNRLGVFHYGINPPKNSNVFQLATCSNVIRIKRLDFLVTALALLKTKLDFCWYCIGDGDELELIKNLVSKNGLNKNVIFLGRLSNKDVQKFYLENHIDLFVNVSSTEGVPVSVMEALSFGIPCLCTDVGGTGEILNEKCGKLLNENVNADILSESILSFVNSPENIKECCINQWDSVCNADKLYTDWIKTLGDLK